ncbi:hypothetical protein JWH04_05715 [Xanthomonas melonis]|uniref:hypothetical protein n=1 Tax=Xanthomonas melonis TaxID=56456 RepID=UPI001E488FDD|nr:hypothetical protein [Xanthomonas melonis]MCD0278446.1 hypothetical protein [Xanthomonas melonis]
MRIAQSYFDDTDSSPLDVYLGSHQYHDGDIFVELDGVPLLKNRNTEELLLPPMTKAMVDHYVNKAIEAGERDISIRPRALGSKRYTLCDKFNFKYSQIDYEFIPGLMRPWDDGFLTPVFFNIAVLNKYSQDPRYKLDLFSETYGTIDAKDWNIAFGINRNKRVIMWLGDIDDLPEDEQYFLRSENIDSDHDLHSEFYEAQIDVVFSDRSKQNELLHLRKSLNELFNEKHGQGLFVLEGEVATVINNLTRPIFWEERHVGPAIESLNRVFVESINIAFLKEAVKDKDSTRDLKSAGSLKTLQAWLEVVMGQSAHADLALPFYVLYDFRIVCSHLLSVDKQAEMMQSVNTRLGLDPANRDLELIYDALISALTKSILRIKGCLE